MSAPDFAPALSFFAALSSTPLRPLHTFVRTTGDRFWPPRLEPYRTACVAADETRTHTRLAPRAAILHERGAGRLPTIVLGGLVPDASEQVFLLRRFLLRSGDVYYVQYPRDGFCLDAICAQLGELIAELGAAGQPPVLFGVSFGAGIVLEWLRRMRLSGAQPPISAVVFVSPVTCVADLIAPGREKPTTLLGRALKPYLDETTSSSEAAVERSRSLFLRMFESGAQNKQALRLLMTPAESLRLREAVVGTIRGVTIEGARQRAQALVRMMAPTDYFTPRVLPLSLVPTLILFAEREEVVLDDDAPVRLAFERAPRAYFPQAVTRLIAAKPGDAPVQHASLVFHVFEFLPSLQAFYQRLRRSVMAVA